MLPSLEDQHLLELMSYLSLNQNTSPMYQQHATSPFGSVGSGGSGCTSPMSPNDFDIVRLQNLQALNKLRMYQQHQQQQLLNPAALNRLLQGYNVMQQYQNWQAPQSPVTPNAPTTNDIGLDRVAKFHRSSAGMQ